MYKYNAKSPFHFDLIFYDMMTKAPKRSVKAISVEVDNFLASLTFISDEFHWQITSQSH